jgi:hypothetical protein
MLPEASAIEQALDMLVVIPVATVMLLLLTSR